jgi:hypothetical protein
MDRRRSRRRRPRRARVTRAGGSPVVTRVSGRTTTAATVDIDNFANYTISIRSVYRNWDSAQSAPVTVYCGIL